MHASLSHAQLARRRGRPFQVEQYQGLLARLRDLRVITAEQARWLYRPWREKSARNARARLKQLVTAGYLKADLHMPPRGRSSVHFYQLTHRALSLLGVPPSTSVLARPAQQVLDYLLLRNNVWSEVRAAGYEIASPLLLEQAHHPRALKVVETWALLAIRRTLARLKADPGVSADALSRTEEELRRVQIFAPKALTWEFAYRLTSKGLPEELVLLVVDDPRRQVSRRARSPRSKPAQVDLLPPPGYEGDRLLLRDAESAWDPNNLRLGRPSARYRQWRAALGKRYGPAFLTTDSLFPELWAQTLPVNRSPTQKDTDHEDQS